MRKRILRSAKVVLVWSVVVVLTIDSAIAYRLLGSRRAEGAARWCCCQSVCVVVKRSCFAPVPTCEGRKTEDSAPTTE